MKTTLLFLFISIEAMLAMAQPLPILTDRLVAPSATQPYKNFVEYHLDRILLYNGKGKESKYFYIIDKSTGNKVFEYGQKDSEARRFVPKFFKADAVDNLIILCMSLEGNYSWGTHLFIIDHGEVFYPGFLNFGVDNFNFSSLALYSQFEQHGEWFKMFFQNDIKIINYTTEDLIKGNAIEFKIEKDKITRLK